MTPIKEPTPGTGVPAAELREQLTAAMCCGMSECPLKDVAKEKGLTLDCETDHFDCRVKAIVEILTTRDAAVRNAALEEAAQLCENDRLVSGSIGPLMDVGYSTACRLHAKAIRALTGEPPQGLAGAKTKEKT